MPASARISGRRPDRRRGDAATDGAASDTFGSSVAISGDTAVVGARRDTVGANIAQGSVYVFLRSGAMWSQQQKLSAGDGVSLTAAAADVTTSGGVTVNADSDADNLGTFNLSDAGAAVSGSSIQVTAADANVVGTLSSAGIVRMGNWVSVPG